MKRKSLSFPVRVRSSREEVYLRITGAVEINVRKKRRQRIKLRPLQAYIAQGAHGTIILQPAPRSKKLRRALRKGRKLLSAKGRKKGRGRATIKFTFSDMAGNRKTITRRVRVVV